MNSIIYLTFDFKKIIFQKNNKISIINKFINNKEHNQLTPNKKNLNKFNLKRYIIKTFNDNFPLVIFYLIYFFGSKTGKYLAKKYL